MTLNLRSVHWFPSQRRLHSCGIPAHQYTAPFVVLRKLTRAPLASLTTSTDRLTSAEARVQIEQRAPIAPEFTGWLHSHREHELRANASTEYNAAAPTREVPITPLAARSLERCSGCSNAFGRTRT